MNVGIHEDIRSTEYYDDLLPFVISNDEAMGINRSFHELCDSSTLDIMKVADCFALLTVPIRVFPLGLAQLETYADDAYLK